MEYVRWLQSALNQIRGLRLPIDGVMAPETRSALRAFQQDKGLPADGIAGPETKEALRAARAAPDASIARAAPDDSAGGTAPDVVASPEPIPEPTAESKAEPQELETLELEDTLWESEVDRGSRTYMIWVQQSLNRIDAAGLAVDGIKGPLTSAAIRAFQTRQRLTADAIVGPLTEAALVKSGASQPPGSSPPVGGTPAPGTRPSTPSRSPTSGTPSVTVASNARVTASAVRALESILHGAGLSSAFITSGQRDSADQARVMYNNLASFGVSEQKRLYGSYGDQVIDVYVAEKAKGRSASAIQAAMRARIVALGCYNVSHHCSDSQDVIDVAPSSISDHAAFLRALTAALASGLVTKFLTPNDSDPAFHIELADASSAGELMDEILLAPPLPPRAFVPDQIARRLHTLRQRAG